MRALTRTALVVTIIAAVAALSACSGSPAEVPTITSVSYSQSQALPNFDSSSHTTTDPADIADLTRVLQEFDVTGSYSSDRNTDGCTGALSTMVVYTTADNSEVMLDVEGNCKATKFDAALGELVRSWRSR